MKKNEWKFNESRNTMIITQRQILTGEAYVLHVSHDIEDGMWQFLDGSTCDMENAIIISLEEMFQVDNTIMNLADLPLGAIACRNDINKVWEIKIRNE